ncbi:HK97 family phage prohead protease [Cohnella massiliensis]|uniref:HK97 family phage prohead protease n=1 Tax=Cohnella massiliensis TaxID=1816691 RepID=UPI001FE31FA4|nr:HK97 family phage prohead protease [Cohnella massiliensis]
MKELETKKPTKEIRALPVTFEVRENESEDGKRTITGAIKYNTESAEMRDYWGDVCVGTICTEGFKDGLAARTVVPLWSHDAAQVLGNAKSGTLRLTNMENELRFELDIPNTTVGNDAWELIQRGDVDGVSFGMKVTKDKWSSEKRDNGRIYRRNILNAELYEISPVAFPAYPANEVAARSLEEFKAEEQRAADRFEKEKLLLELDLYG